MEDLLPPRSTAVAKRVVRSAKKFVSLNDNPHATEKEYESLLDDLSGFIWNCQKDFGISWKELAVKANLSPVTIEKLRWRETKRPQLRTVLAIMSAFGFRISVTPGDKPLGAHEINLTTYRKDARRAA